MFCDHLRHLRLYFVFFRSNILTFLIEIRDSLFSSDSEAILFYFSFELNSNALNLKLWISFVYSAQNQPRPNYDFGGSREHIEEAAKS